MDNKIKNKINKFNDYIGNKLSDGLSNMHLFWIILIITMIPAIFNPPKTIVDWLSYFSNSMFQSVSMPVLNYTSNKLMNYFQKLLEEVRDTIINDVTISIKEELEIIKLEQQNQIETNNELKDIIEAIQNDQQLENEENSNIKELVVEMRELIENSHNTIINHIDNNNV